MKTNNRQEIALLAEALLEPFVRLCPIYIDIAGSIAGGLFLAQLYWWRDKGKREDGFIYKTLEEWQDEIRITRREWEKARKVLQKKGILEVKRFGLDPKLYYRLNLDNFYQAIIDQSRKNKQSKSSTATPDVTLVNGSDDVANRQMLHREVAQVTLDLYTENTKTENTNIEYTHSKSARAKKNLEVETDPWMNESKNEIHESTQPEDEVLEAEIVEEENLDIEYKQENAGFAQKMSRNSNEISLGCNESLTEFKGAKQSNSGGDNYPGLLNKTSKIEQIRARAQRETINRQYFESVEDYDNFVGKYKLYLIGLGKKEAHANGIIYLMEKRVKDGELNSQDREAISRYRNGTLNHQSEKEIKRVTDEQYAREALKSMGLE